MLGVGRLFAGRSFCDIMLVTEDEREREPLPLVDDVIRMDEGGTLSVTLGKEVGTVSLEDVCGKGNLVDPLLIPRMLPGCGVFPPLDEGMAGLTSRMPRPSVGLAG
jgi:hypothetical protein